MGFKRLTGLLPATAYVVASDAPSSIKEQAQILKAVYGDLIQICDGMADNVEIQAAIDAINGTGNRGSVKLFGKSFICSTQIEAKSEVNVFGPTEIRVSTDTNTHGIYFNNVTNSIWKDITVRRQGTPTANLLVACSLGGTTDSSVELHDCKFINELSSAAQNGFYGIWIRNSASPKLYNCYGRGGTCTQYGDGIRIINTASPTLINCEGGGGVGTGAETRYHGIWVRDASTPTLLNCIGRGGTNVLLACGIIIDSTQKVIAQGCRGYGGDGTWSNGIQLSHSVNAYLTNCEGIGGDGGTMSCGIMIEGNVRGLIFGCRGEGGDGGTNCYGLWTLGEMGYDAPTVTVAGSEFVGGSGGADCHGAIAIGSTVFAGCTARGGDTSGAGWAIGDGSPALDGCIGVGGRGGGRAFLFQNTASPILSGCTGKYWEYGGTFQYAGAGTSFRPFADIAYQVVSIGIYVNVAGGGGSTLDLGTTLAGNEIANNIPIATTGWKSFTFTCAKVAAAGYIYATPSDVNTRFRVYYTVTNQVASSDGLYSESTGYGKVTNSHFIANGASDGCYIDSTAGVGWEFHNCHFETLDTSTRYAINSESVINGAQFRKCTLVGTTNNVQFINETFIVSGSLIAGNANAICFAWHNPELQDILIKKVVVEVTTGGSTAGSHLDVGIADDAAGTNRGTEFFNDLLLNDVDINDSLVAGDGGTQTKWVFCQDSVSATDGWIVGQILDANAAALVGKYYIEYAGR